MSKKLFNKILVANRGEIAVRVIKACKDLGITSASIYSDADASSLHRIIADESYYIGNSPASESYLNKKEIIDLALKIGAEAIHPGYGFLSENPDFIEMVENTKLKFIGPSSESVRAMGNKTAARELMKKNNVPIVPGTTKPINDINEGMEVCDKIGYPILLKAAAGGGGKGMRKVFSKDQFESAFESTKREAMKAFANDEVYIEKLIDKPKHIEVQVIADEHGNFRHLFERECSIQRRHQKIIEESPSVFVDQQTREKITEAAINAAKACGYFNAGTIEFLMDSKKAFYFLEMNTRLQVEHPVTELVTGIDLVKEQISIAAGQKISFDQKDIAQKGFAIECRIYAEDSANEFLPSTGKISFYEEPVGEGIRIDSGFRENMDISIYYDPMISKLITWGASREETISKMLDALNDYKIAGISHNIKFLQNILKTEVFYKGLYDINFVEQQILNDPDKLKDLLSDEEEQIAAALFGALLKHDVLTNKQNVKPEKTSNIWRTQLYE